MAENLNIMNRIKIFINPANIPDILNECDIYLSTSLFEGLSNSIMEAMVAGLPVIATDVGDNKYLVKDGFN
jgi:glycosyltransferase involved in cell wall biosynthesis